MFSALVVYCEGIHRRKLDSLHKGLIMRIHDVWHYIDVIMATVAYQITSLTVVYSIVYSYADQGKHQSSASLVIVRGIHRDRWIPRTKPSNAEYGPIWRRHHGYLYHDYVYCNPIEIWYNFMFCLDITRCQQMLCVIYIKAIIPIGLNMIK